MQPYCAPLAGNNPHFEAGISVTESCACNFPYLRFQPTQSSVYSNSGTAAMDYLVSPGPTGRDDLMARFVDTVARTVPICRLMGSRPRLT
jgi:hypothetical protein